MTPEDLEHRLAALETRLDALEQTSIPLQTTQVQPVDEVSATATTDQVRTAVRQIADALRTLGLGG